MPTLLREWESFYLIVGTAAAALVGLQFVVMALVADSTGAGSTSEIDAFGTPTVVHFSAALLISGVVTAPWTGLLGPHAMLVLIGGGGLGYGAVVVRRARRTSGYTPVLEDWIWHGVLPFVAYASTLGAGLWLRHDPAPMLFVVGAVALLLLFIGIHNAWDTVTYVAVVHRRRPRAEPRPDADRDAP